MSKPEQTVIAARGLRKSYNGTEALKGLDLEVARGEVFALLGPNGAGKTTTVEILEGHRKRSSGEISVLGFDPERGERAFKERIGIVLQQPGVEAYLTVEEVLDLYRGFYARPRPLEEIIELVGLESQRKTLVRKLSGGQVRRLDVGIGLAGDPDLLFLDEPTTGFDPSARRNAWQMIKNLSALGKTTFLTTHYMDEAQNLADRVAIIVDGKIVAEGPPETLTPHDARTRIVFQLPEDAPPLPDELVRSVSVQGPRVEVETTEPMRVIHTLTGWAIDNNTELQRLSVSRPSLEDVYLQLTDDATEDGDG